MNVEKALLGLLVVLAAARLAAELAERLNQPAVLAEILAGILIGPSVLGLVQGGELLHLIGELGAILLLFEVGLQMNLAELRRVGGDSLRVAFIGIAAPMILGLIVLRGMGVSPEVALFAAAALTATSVGITARVFGDLRALATPEARTVLGAAVADDIGGLLILTTVAALGAGQQLGVGAVAGIVAGALGFVVLATAGSAWLAPRLFATVLKRSRTEGSLMGFGLIFALGIALLASAAHLAPIVGAFIAGLAVGRSPARDELGRRLAPLAHFFVPIFFLYIGIQTDLAVFARRDVLLLVGVLTVIAVAGKLAAGLGVRKGRAGRMLVGVAMVPRGEVGLIFAGIGLGAGILDSRFYGVLLAVVLITTLITPPWVRKLIQKAKSRAVATGSAAVEPDGGWLRVTGEEVELRAEPPDFLAGRIGFEAALLCEERPAGPWLLQWLSSAEREQTQWDAALRRRFFQLLSKGSARSWRFLQATGLLAAYLPSLDAAAAHRKRDPFNLDPAGDLRWELLEGLQALVGRSDRADDPRIDAANPARVWDRLVFRDQLYLAALAASAFPESGEAPGQAAQLAASIGLGQQDQDLIRFLVNERRLLPAAAKRLDMGAEDAVLGLAAHVGRPEHADALYLLAVAEDDMESWQRDRLDALFEMVQDALCHRGETGSREFDLVRLRRQELDGSLAHLPAGEVARHLESAPRRYLAAHGPDVIAKHLQMTASPPTRDEVRLEAEPAKAGQWTVYVAARDRRGLLASIAGAFAGHSIPVEEAFVSTWRDGIARDVFKVRVPAGGESIDWQQVRDLISAGLAQPSVNGRQPETIEGVVDIDNLASPWHTIVEVRAYDRTGLLHKVASALARAGLEIHMALVHTAGEVAVDIFYVTGRNGGKLDEKGERDLRAALAGSPSRRWRLFGRNRIEAGV